MCVSIPFSNTPRFAPQCLWTFHKLTGYPAITPTHNAPQLVQTPRPEVRSWFVLCNRTSLLLLTHQTNVWFILASIQKLNLPPPFVLVNSTAIELPPLGDGQPTLIGPSPPLPTLRPEPTEVQSFDGLFLAACAIALLRLQGEETAWFQPQPYNYLPSPGRV